MIPINGYSESNCAIMTTKLSSLSQVSFLALHFKFKALHFNCRGLHINFKALHINCRGLHLSFKAMHVCCRAPYLNCRCLRLDFRDLRLNFRALHILFTASYLIFRGVKPDIPLSCKNRFSISTRHYRIDDVYSLIQFINFQTIKILNYENIY